MSDDVCLEKENVVANDTQSATTWSEWRDLNPRSLGPEPSAIPSFATPGCNCCDLHEDACQLRPNFSHPFIIMEEEDVVKLGCGFFHLPAGHTKAGGGNLCRKRPPL